MQLWRKCGGYWNCLHYKGEGPTSNSEENTRINARLLESKDTNEMFSNFVAQEASRKTEAELLDVQSLQKRMDALRRAMPPDARTTVDTQFLYDAILQVRPITTLERILFSRLLEYEYIYVAHV